MANNPIIIRHYRFDNFIDHPKLIHGRLVVMALVKKIADGLESCEADQNYWLQKNQWVEEGLSSFFGPVVASTPGTMPWADPTLTWYFSCCAGFVELSFWSLEKA